MTALHESATNEHANARDPAERVLVCAPNWLGDTLMAMPSIRALYDHIRPTPEVTVLSNPALLTLWRLFSKPVRVLRLDRGLGGTCRTVQRLRKAAFTQAIILPNSFRSAFLPFAAGIPVRRGLAGHQRRLLLTQTISHPAVDNAMPVHQCCEYAAVANVPLSSVEAAEPVLSIPANARLTAAERWGDRMTGEVLMLFPGAARGPSKRWPASSFIELGRRWLHDTNGSIMVAGTMAEHELCETMSRNIGAKAANLAGKTPLPELAALIDMCSVVVGNDSGGTHLAAALATPVVSIFGQTDPAVTCPRGKHVRIIAAATAAANRRIDREAPAAQALLAAISVDTVFEAAMAVMNESRHEG